MIAYGHIFPEDGLVAGAHWTRRAATRAFPLHYTRDNGEADCDRCHIVYPAYVVDDAVWARVRGPWKKRYLCKSCFGQVSVSAAEAKRADRIAKLRAMAASNSPREAKNAQAEIDRLLRQGTPSDRTPLRDFGPPRVPRVMAEDRRARFQLPGTIVIPRRIARGASPRGAQKSGYPECVHGRALPPGCLK